MSASVNVLVCLAAPHVNIDGAKIHQDRHGRFCLNDLHQASGGERKNQSQYFLDNVKTQELVQALITTGIPVLPIEIINGGNIAKYLADSYSDTLNTEREKYEVEWEAIKNG